jgi:hypothetical protein
MNPEQASPDDLALLRATFPAGGDHRPPLGWEAVRAFEAAHGTVLPEPYRTFLAEIAGGSPSGPPSYGLLGPAELPADWGDDRPRREPGLPFPLTARLMWEGREWEEDDTDTEEIDALVDRVFDHGSLVLGTDGCGMNWHLVVTGPHRGHIWMIAGEGADPFGAEFGGTTAAPGFAGWVRHWAEGKDWYDAV